MQNLQCLAVVCASKLLNIVLILQDCLGIGNTTLSFLILRISSERSYLESSMNSSQLIHFGCVCVLCIYLCLTFLFLTGSYIFVLILTYSFACLFGCCFISGVCGCGNVVDAIDKTKPTAGGSFPPALRGWPGSQQLS